ncbi:hypothetical protein JCM19046_325 [Bacillus sp. JCM 19046]|nr:hypothetical protein JCM19046_325 [Bacillus sp. JCM 19046]
MRTNKILIMITNISTRNSPLLPFFTSSTFYLNHCYFITVLLRIIIARKRQFVCIFTI